MRAGKSGFSLAASIFRAGGFTAAANMPGGYQAWPAGFPTVKSPDASKKAADTQC
jgi:hypothetical protein